MRKLAALLIFLILLVATPGYAQSACPDGAFSVSQTPDGTSLTILFDAFTVESGGSAVAHCSLSVPLALPDGYSLGVYRVDYRGYAHLARGETAELTVDYNLGKRDNGKRFRRKTSGEHDGDFIFTENIGAGLMRRVGCGEAAELNVSIDLALRSTNGMALATLDSTDGATRGLVYYFDLKKCR
jgi:hypothetical protein